MGIGRRAEPGPGTGHRKGDPAVRRARRPDRRGLVRSSAATSLDAGCAQGLVVRPTGPHHIGPRPCRVMLVHRHSLAVHSFEADSGATTRLS